MLYLMVDIFCILLLGLLTFAIRFLRYYRNYIFMCNILTKYYEFGVNYMDGKKILLVEDESTVALDIQHILESSGYQVPFVTSNGEAAVKEAVKIRPDLVLMDITLKGTMDGIEAASKIIILNIPVVYLTAHSDNLTLKRATQIPVIWVYC